MIRLKTKEEIEILREGGRKLARILKELSRRVEAGVSTEQIDTWARELVKAEGGRPAFLHYKPYGATRPFPGAICVSKNEEIIHGIPNENIENLKEGDIVSLDLGFVYKNMITDSAITIPVGKVSKEARDLLSETKKALEQGIKHAKVGKRVGDISNAISRVALKNNFGVVKELAGHGVGFEVHEDPYVPNWGERESGPKLEEGLVIAVEPMFTLGASDVRLCQDGYTYKTADGSLSAHFEHTIAVTADGVIILTR